MNKECTCGQKLEFNVEDLGRVKCPFCGTMVIDLFRADAAPHPGPLPEEREAAKPPPAAMDRMDNMDGMDPARANRERVVTPQEAHLAAARARNSLSLEKVQKAEARRNWNILVVALVVMGVLSVWVINTSIDDVHAGRSVPYDAKKADAHYTAEGFIKKQIVGARTVSSFRESVVTAEGNTYLVAVNVDGLNAFGGPVRQALIVEMTLDEGRNVWQLVKIHHK